MGGHYQAQRSAKGVQLLQTVDREVLYRRDQHARTPALVGHAESSSLPDLEESSFRFVRHSLRL